MSIDEEEDDRPPVPRRAGRGWSPRGGWRLVLLAAVALVTAGAVATARLTGNDDSRPAMPTAAAGPDRTAMDALDVPAPEECLVTPRSTQALVALFATPAASPVGTAAAGPGPLEAPAGTPAPVETVVQAAAVYRESVACLNAGAFARAFALYSDDYVRRLLAGASAQTGIGLDLIAVALATPYPPAPMDWTGIRAVGGADHLADGRLRLFVVTRRVAGAATPAAGTGDTPHLVVFVAHDGRWLIDDILTPPIDIGSPTP